MVVSVVGSATFAASSNTDTATITLPTVQDNDWLFVFAGAAGAGAGTPSTTNTGTIGGSLTQIGTVQTVSGHGSSAWKRKLAAADSAKTVEIVMQANTAKPVMIGLIVRGADTTNAADNYASSISAVGSTTNTTPFVTTTADNCAELNAVFSTTGAGTQISVWTAPYPITKEVEIETPGATTRDSVAVGHNMTPVAAGSSIGNRAWVSDQSGTRSAWTISVQPMILTSNLAWVNN